MKLPKELTTVTPLSKTLAIIFFVTFPLIGFYFGMTYQKQLDVPQNSSEIVLQPLTRSEKEIRKNCYDDASRYVEENNKNKQQNPVNWHYRKFEECLKQYGLKPIMHYTDYSYTYE